LIKYNNNRKIVMPFKLPRHNTEYTLPNIAAEFKAQRVALCDRIVIANQVANAVYRAFNDLNASDVLLENVVIKQSDDGLYSARLTSSAKAQAAVPKESGKCLMANILLLLVADVQSESSGVVTSNPSLCRKPSREHRGVFFEVINELPDKIRLFLREYVTYLSRPAKDKHYVLTDEHQYIAMVAKLIELSIGQRSQSLENGSERELDELELQASEFKVRYVSDRAQAKDYTLAESQALIGLKSVLNEVMTKIRAKPEFVSLEHDKTMSGGTHVKYKSITHQSLSGLDRSLRQTLVSMLALHRALKHHHDQGHIHGQLDAGAVQYQPGVDDLAVTLLNPSVWLERDKSTVPARKFLEERRPYCDVTRSDVEIEVVNVGHDQLAFAEIFMQKIVEVFVAKLAPLMPGKQERVNFEFVLRALGDEWQPFGNCFYALSEKLIKGVDDAEITAELAALIQVADDVMASGRTLEKLKESLDWRSSPIAGLSDVDLDAENVCKLTGGSSNFYTANVEAEGGGASASAPGPQLV
jgi:hypothetical protein